MFIVPQGFTDLLPEKAEVFYFVKGKLVSLFQSHGFLPLVPPSIELLNTFSVSGESEEETFNFIDHAEGKTACFRYDFTPQVARILSNHVFSFPLKFCYDGVVLRNSKRLSGENREIYQSGVEIIGDETTFADIELIILSDKIFQLLGIKNYKIFLSDAGIIKSLFMGDDKKNVVPKEIKDAFIEKNITLINSIAHKLNISKEKRRFLADLPLMCGDIKLISELEKIYKIKEVQPYLTRLRKIGREAENLGISVEFDLGEVRGFEYHSGVILDGYAEDDKGVYHEVITGGRYDNLLKGYLGQSVPATGFAVDVTKLCACVKYSHPLFLLILAEKKTDLSQVHKVAELFRSHGVNVNILNASNKCVSKICDDKKYDFVMIFNTEKIKIFNGRNKAESVVKKINSNFIKNFLKDVVK